MAPSYCSVPHSIKRYDTFRNRGPQARMAAREGGVEELIPLWHIFISGVCFAKKVVVKVLVTQSCLTLVTPWTDASQASLSMEFSKQVYWSGLPFPFPGDLPNSGIEPESPELQTDSLTSEPPGSLLLLCAFLYHCQEFKLYVNL